MLCKPSALEKHLVTDFSDVLKDLFLTLCFHQSFSSFRTPQNPLGGLVQTRRLGPNPKVLDSGGLEWGLREWEPNKLPGDADVVTSSLYVLVSLSVK